MKFRTEITIPESDCKINYRSQVVLFGSCFTENIEQKLSYFKFRNSSNPHGILFNPKAIEKAIDDCIQNKVYQKSDLEYFNDLWISMNHHSRFSSPGYKDILNTINSSISKNYVILKEASHIIITLGTSWIYRYLKNDAFVANCHKIPQKEYSRELLQTEQVLESLQNMIKVLLSFNPDIHIIFTVSPVRHLKDGFTENTLSKATLITAIHKVIDQKRIFYFPSYEIMMDDLRDYRFYKKDMVHPNEIAIDYIWEHFKKTWIKKEDAALMKEIDTIQKAMMHKPFNKESEKHQKFLTQLEKKIKDLQEKFPFLDF